MNSSYVASSLTSEQRAQSKESEGYAVATADRVLINTVSDTRRAAIVNYLCTEAHYLVLKTESDDEIERVFKRRCGESRVVRVLVQVSHEARSDRA